jgi:class 3 adenylate cyclase
MNASEIDDLLNRHYGESTGSMRRCSISELGRSECTSRPYFIFKIDLVNSTGNLQNQKPASYARIAHAYLSTIDAITQRYGAEPEQTEYQGDGVLALFPERGNTAAELVTAAVHAHYAVNKLRRVAGVNLHPKIVLDYAELTVAKIGPPNETHRVAIGLPIHTVAKREKTLKSGTIWLSDALARKFTLAVRARLFSATYVDVTRFESVLVSEPPEPREKLGNLLSGLGAIPPPPTLGATALLGLNSSMGIPTYQGGLMAGFGLPPLPRPVTLLTHHEERPVTRRELDGYEVKIIPAYRELDLPLGTLS